MPKTTPATMAFRYPAARHHRRKQYPAATAMLAEAASATIKCPYPSINGHAAHMTPLASAAARPNKLEEYATQLNSPINTNGMQTILAIVSHDDASANCVEK
ncbi:MAG: hypothetical protein U0836_06155 [Pirellulales bacterium]